MVVHKCDACGKEMEKWLAISVFADATHERTNISDLIPYARIYEICQDCYIRDYPFRKERV